MTVVQAPSDLATTAELAAGTAQFLSPVVLDLEALVVNGKQAHWHVRGGSFIGVHELLDVPWIPVDLPLVEQLRVHLTA